MSRNELPEMLRRLLLCHSTPGDEDHVAHLLASEWLRSGWTVSGHGRYALSAAMESPDASAQTVLICAHMDSPGFIVESCNGPRARLVHLGGVTFEGETTPGVVKVDGEAHAVTIHQERHSDTESRYWMCPDVSVSVGDRVCFRAVPRCDSGGIVHSPFLDNRLGCYVLCELAGRMGIGRGVRIVLAATGSEELGGFGAPVLARAIQPDIVFCLDATYEAPEQNVTLGRGPVLTLSDASVLLGSRVRDAVLAAFGRVGVPLQTEVYNYSGTDSRAFPHQGLPGPVLPLLLPSTGNHSPGETASLADVRSLVEALDRICTAEHLAPLLELGFCGASS